jgi:hypothetical protein
MASSLARITLSRSAALPLMAALIGCGASSGGEADGNGFDAGGGDGGTTALHWFSTCGPPVGFVGDAGPPDSGVASCTTEQEGEACASAGLECQPTNGTPLRCAASDPKLQPGGCPISSRRFKDDIRYLNDGDLERIAAEVEHIRLARYFYKSDPSARQRLGFIIEDDPDSPAVAEGKTQIDLYGYTSMVVAAMKVQARTLEKQSAELAALRQRVKALEASRSLRRSAMGR